MASLYCTALHPVYGLVWTNGEAVFLASVGIVGDKLRTILSTQLAIFEWVFRPLCACNEAVVVGCCSLIIIYVLIVFIIAIVVWMSYYTYYQYLAKIWTKVWCHIIMAHGVYTIILPLFYTVDKISHLILRESV